MRELTYYVAVSLDGRIAAPSGAFDAFSAEGDHMEVVLGEFRDTIPARGLTALGLTAELSRFDTVLMGWNTYAVGLPDATDPYPHLRQYVFSRSPGRSAPGILTADDPVELVRALKREEGSGIWLCGGGQLAAALVDEIDELVLKVNPVLLGDGVPLFGPLRYAARGFTLTGSTSYASGVVINRYRR